MGELERAADVVEADLERLQAEEAALRRSVAQQIGSFSDLRYGRLANAQLPKDVAEGLSALQEACTRNQ